MYPQFLASCLEHRRCSINICWMNEWRRRNTKEIEALYSAHRETVWLSPPVNGCRKEEINTPPPVLQNTWPFYFTFSPLLSLCSIKETSIQTWTKWIFWDLSLSASQPASFPNKVITSCLKKKNSNMATNLFFLYLFIFYWSIADL